MTSAMKSSRASLLDADELEGEIGDIILSTRRVS